MAGKWRPWVRGEGRSKITPRQWQKSRSPGQMIDHLEATQRVSRTPGGVRKLLLFNVACCRRGWGLLDGDPVRPVLEAAERYADRGYRRDRLVRLIDRVRAEVGDSLPDRLPASEWCLQKWLTYGGAPRQIDNLRLAVLCVADPMRVYGLDSHHHTIAHGVAGRGLVTELSAECALLRDIFGDPFHAAQFSPEWRTDTAFLLARQMYESRDFFAMPILADALQDAGCDSDDILAHCRHPEQAHVRGCWVVDAVLGKK